MSNFWYFLGDFFESIFKLVPFFGLWMNKLLIVIAFVAFFLWLRHMRKSSEVEKFD